MSRNLCRVDCHQCESKVVLTGNLYRLPDDHFAEPGMIVSDAHCSRCSARYTAWVGPPRPERRGRGFDIDTLYAVGFYDLSYRGNFNDEPIDGDLPGRPDKTSPTRSANRPGFKHVRDAIWAAGRIHAGMTGCRSACKRDQACACRGIAAGNLAPVYEFLPGSLGSGSSEVAKMIQESCHADIIAAVDSFAHARATNDLPKGDNALPDGHAPRPRERDYRQVNADTVTDQHGRRTI